MFGFRNSFMERIVNLPVSGIKAIVSSHLEILIRDMRNKQFNEINGRKSPLNERVVFMLIIMESYQFPIVGINPGKSDDRTSQIAADIFNNGFGITETGLCINVESIFVFMVNVSFQLFKGGTNAFFKLI